MTPERLARLHEAVDRQSAETLTYQPMAAPSVNARPAADPDRTVEDFAGIWSEPPVPAEQRPHLDMAAARQGGMRRISAGRPTVKFADGALPYAARRGDRVLRPLTGERHEVADIAGDGYGRTILFLTARGS